MEEPEKKCICVLPKVRRPEVQAKLREMTGNHHERECPMWTTRDLHRRGEWPVVS